MGGGKAWSEPTPTYLRMAKVGEEGNEDREGRQSRELIHSTE